MTPCYPDGRKFVPAEKRAKRKIPSAANRGMGFEKDINDTNGYYLEKGLALIYKRPTPINIVKVDYAHGAKITQAYFEAQSTTDYNGVYKGHYLDFEAKSTRSKTSFPLGNIAPQQVRHLRNVQKNGGIAFFIINWYAHGETYILDASYVCDFYECKPRKSIPYRDCQKNGHLVKEGYRPRYDYLPLVERFFLK
ncbi:MAG: Holliday junction resolvase RecU [Bacilli bacterium]|jgi:recombination protein U|nr:Holliday junction resolvase RecU [Bacilli bacterium]